MVSSISTIVTAGQRRLDCGIVGRRWFGRVGPYRFEYVIENTKTCTYIEKSAAFVVVVVVVVVAGTV